jgi:hypothetical protein
VVCALKLQECSNCLLKNNCIYAFVFETEHAVNIPESFRAVAPPHPFVIEPPLSAATLLEKGSFFDFSLVLFGEINNSLPYFIYAFDHMGKIGIGKKVEGKRGRFRLLSVYTDGRIIYSENDLTLKSCESTGWLELKINPEPSPRARARLNIRYL